MKLIKNIRTKSAHDAYELVRYTVADVKGAGRMLIAATDEGLCWLGMTDSVARLKKQYPKSVLMRDDSLKKLGVEIAALWTGRRRALSLPVVLSGTPFQISVWDQLLKIKCGDTLTYQDIARNIGKPRAVRAVGSAVGSNPITLLVPCHRVLSKTGGKLKFGWGPEAKKKLLTAEGVRV